MRKMNRVRVGLIGIGIRGYGLLEDIILQMEDVDVTAVCDQYEDRCIKAADKVLEVRGTKPYWSVDYKDILARDDVDAVVITGAWECHVPITIAAMKAGKYVGCEVGGAFSIKQCWDLVDTYQETGAFCMMLENCCFGRDELMLLNMARKGVFGEIVHCASGYHHDLRDEVSSGRENRHYRFCNYLYRNCENYPTHIFGPLAEILNINRGNRLMTLTSVAAKSVSLNAYNKELKGADYDLATMHFNQGDMVTTTMTCANGETIVLNLDTSLPRFSSRGLYVHGTKGMYAADCRSIFLDGVHKEFVDDWKPQWDNLESYREEYESPIWKRFTENGVKGTHGGMDWLTFRAFFDCIENQLPPMIDIYDMATWMSITTLSEESVSLNGHPVAMPDFTNGEWMHRNPDEYWTR